VLELDGRVPAGIFGESAGPVEPGLPGSDGLRLVSRHEEFHVIKYLPPEVLREVSQTVLKITGGQAIHSSCRISIGYRDQYTYLRTDSLLFLKNLKI